jgi:hypothetical protein
MRPPAGFISKTNVNNKGSYARTVMAQSIIGWPMLKNGDVPTVKVVSISVRAL